MRHEQADPAEMLKFITDNSFKKFVSTTKTTQQSRRTPHASQTVDAIQEHCLNRLSPDLQKKIRELERKPYLPDWPKTTRGMLNFCLRSALFGIIKRGQRKAVKGEIIAAVKGLDIRYTGWKLDQGDFDVLVQSFHIQNHHLEKTPDYYIRFQAKSFLRSIGRQPGKSGREWLKDCFRRLTAQLLSPLRPFRDNQTRTTKSCKRRNNRCS